MKEFRPNDRVWVKSHTPGVPRGSEGIVKTVTPSDDNLNTWMTLDRYTGKYLDEELELVVNGKKVVRSEEEHRKLREQLDNLTN